MSLVFYCKFPFQFPEMINRFITIVLLFVALQATSQNQKQVRVGIVGLVHDHVKGILNRSTMDNLEIVGIAEPNQALAESYSKKYGFRMELVYSSLEEMITKTKPEAVMAFNSTFDHLKTVEYCAPRGIHIMVEKPLAVNANHASKMTALAKQNNVFLLTNYETTWYGSNKRAWEIVNDEKKIGDIRKIVFHTGHKGPMEIGCTSQFLAWLTDPVLNGGGALMDFGCYGANLCTWLLKDEIPLTVSAITQTLKPDVYPKVDDEATIVITYPKAQVIIQASWNWPYGRKDMEVYGRTGLVFCMDKENMMMKESDQKEKSEFKAPPLADDRRDPFVYFANVVRGAIKMNPRDLSGPENNETVVRILEAAKQSASTGKTIVWKEFNKK